MFWKLEMYQAWEQLQRSGGVKAGRGLKEHESKPQMQQVRNSPGEG